MDKRQLGGASASSHILSSPQTDDVTAFVQQTKPRYPVAVLRPDVLKRKAEEFKSFPGRVLYAVKANPDLRVLNILIESGVDSFDCASIGEVRMIRSIKPDSTIYFMHPIKARESIREAYFEHNIRAFVLDSADELQKILEETDYAKDLTLFVRICMPKQNVAYDFTAKFGAPPILAVQLLAAARPHCAKLGVSFHIGTQCTDTNGYADAVRVTANIVKSSGVPIDELDIGGGFPTELDRSNPPPPLSDFITTVKNALIEVGMQDIDLLCEPGRALVASAGALVVRVEGRKGDMLYINDGTYGGIFEACGSIGLSYPAQMIRTKGAKPSSKIMPFRFAGPTCDSVDMMNGPFMLPDNIGEGDYILLDQLGAYGEISRTPFNGFTEVINVIETGMPQRSSKPVKKSKAA